MLTCLIGDNKINLVENKYEKEELKKWSSKRILKCPICGKDYEYCHGKVKMPYFRHKDKEECNYLYSESETQEHLQGKTDLYNWLLKQPNVTKVELEAYIPETKQRPDIMFEWNGQICVIEYQCTPISSEYYERHELYEVCGIKDIWICGAEKYFQCYHNGSGIKHISEIEKNTNLYYDTKVRCIFQIDRTIKENIFELIIKGKSYAHRMINLFDYKKNQENFYLVKDLQKSYYVCHKYPSPTGRPSRKYPYPVSYYSFNKKYSLAKCMSLNSIRLKEVK